MELNWSSLSPEAFEKLCCRLLDLSGFTNIQHYGAGGGDKGRDIVASRPIEPLPNVVEMSKWVVQCKRYTEKRLGKTELSDFLTSAREHNPDNVLVVVTRNLSSNTKDWLESIRKDYRFGIHLWEESELTRYIGAYRRDLSHEFADLIGPTEPVLFSTLDHGTFNFCCREFDELEIVIYNKFSEKEAVKELADFVDFIRNKRIKFISSDGDRAT